MDLGSISWLAVKWHYLSQCELNASNLKMGCLVLRPSPRQSFPSKVRHRTYTWIRIYVIYKLCIVKVATLKKNRTTCTRNKEIWIVFMVSTMLFGNVKLWKTRICQTFHNWFICLCMMLYILSWNGTLYIVTVEYFSILFLDKIILITKVLRDILSYVKKIRISF